MMGRPIAFVLPCALPLAACAPTPADHEPGTIGMYGLVFDTDQRVLPAGARLTFFNTSSLYLALGGAVAGRPPNPRST